MTSMTLEEAQIRTSGNDAEVSVPGVSMIAVIESGSDQFHGTYLFDGTATESSEQQPERQLAGAGPH